MCSHPDILVLGGDGMLGHKIFQRLRASAAVMCTVRGDPPPQVDLLAGPEVIRGIDLMHLDRTMELLSRLRPLFVINCAGIIKQRPQSADAISSLTINSLLPHCLAQWCSAWNGRLIHFSTDCVFSGVPGSVPGTRRGSYREDDPSDAADLYGRSKFLGEVHAHNALTLRTSIIGRELSRHRSLLDWFLAQNHGRIRGFRRVIYSGVTTNHLAGLVERIIRHHPALAGLYQVVSTPISKYDLLLAVREAFRLDIEIAPDEAEISDRGMCGDKLRAAIGYQAPAWPELIAELAQDPTPYERWNHSASPGRQENPDYRWHRLAGQDAGEALAHR